MTIIKWLLMQPTIRHLKKSFTSFYYLNNAEKQIHDKFPKYEKRVRNWQ